MLIQTDNPKENKKMPTGGIVRRRGSARCKNKKDLICSDK